MTGTAGTLSELVQCLGTVSGFGRRMCVSGVEGGAKAYLLAALSRHVARIMVITANQDTAEGLIEDLRFFVPADHETGLRLFPADGVGFSDILPWDRCGRQMETLRNLSDAGPGVVIAPIQAVMERIISRERLATSVVRIETGQEQPWERVIRQLASLGYTRVPMVEERGDMSVRGSLIDIYPIDHAHPVRLEFFGDRIDSMRTFDVENQRSVEVIYGIVVSPVKMSGTGTLFDYLTPDTLVVVNDFSDLERESRRFWGRVKDHGKERRHLSVTEVMSRIEVYPRLDIGALGDPSEDGRIEPFVIDSLSHAGLHSAIRAGGLGVLTEKIGRWLARGWTVVLPAHTEGQARRLAELLEERGTHALHLSRFPGELDGMRGKLGILVGGLSGGFVLPSEGLVVVTEEEIFGHKKRVGHGRRARPTALSNFEDLRPGNYIVHVDYGVGVFRGLTRLAVDHVENDYLAIEYERGDKLYVPVESLNLVSKYVGVGEKPPKLDQLGGMAWKRAKKKAKEATEKIAKELVEIYAARKAFPGIVFPPCDSYFAEFEASFPYDETPDQLSAIGAVMTDMETPRPADRLVCGDVGFGKTEVAVRAAFKAVLGGRQVAVLVPTTVLAQQHYRTFTARFKDYPVTVDVLSRFKSAAEQRDLVERIRQGTVDVVIGTHRLLQDDVVFRDLGLLIVDEEHRFGVTHKEKLKALKKLVDCVTLTATPIPRTLQMSLAGIRDLSIITTPPPNRQSIATYIVRFDKKLIREAILTEVGRAGQVFFVHNRVKDIDVVAATLKEIVPEVRVVVAHGQMAERDLEKAMVRFVNGDVDVLLCTSIIESGLDIPNANTIIINNAERFGLADLYQLRGRVGRAAEKAYAYLIVSPRHELSRDALKRLRAIQELTELGSGFRLAMRDLEIRGAGNLLGHVQSGHIDHVGFELYNSLLENAIKELRGERVDAQVTPEIRVPVEAFIPETYIPDDTQRLMMYKRLSLVAAEEEIEGIMDELEDRFGPVPAQVLNLCEIIGLKVWLSRGFVKRFELRDKQVMLAFSHDGDLSPEKLVAVVAGDGRFRLTPDLSLYFTSTADDWRGVLEETRNLLRQVL